MTPTRYRECLATLGLSQRGLAPYLECSDRLTRAWATGAVGIPKPIAEWLEAWMRNRIEHPDPLPPKDWRSRCGPGADRARVSNKGRQENAA
jgi:hypothetical protein